MYKLCAVCEKSKLPRNFRGNGAICIGCQIGIHKKRKEITRKEITEIKSVKNIGVVKWFDSDKGYGFINTKDDAVFVHYSNIVGTGRRVLKEGQTVEFDLDEVGRKDKEAINKQAINVKILN